MTIRVISIKLPPLFLLLRYLVHFSFLNFIIVITFAIENTQHNQQANDITEQYPSIALAHTYNPQKREKLNAVKNCLYSIIIYHQIRWQTADTMCAIASLYSCSYMRTIVEFCLEFNVWPWL